MTARLLRARVLPLLAVGWSVATVRLFMFPPPGAPEPGYTALVRAWAMVSRVGVVVWPAVALTVAVSVVRGGRWASLLEGVRWRMVCAGVVAATVGPVAAARGGPGVVVLAVVVAVAVADLALVRPLDRDRVSPFALAVGAAVWMALVVRLIAMVRLLNVQATFGDPAYYHLQANLLAAGKGFAEPFTATREGVIQPTALHPPLFSALLSIGSRLGADTYLAHKAIAALASVTGVVAAALLGRRLAGPRVGVVAALLVGIAPNLWMIDGLLWPEGVSTAAVLWLLVAAYRFADRPGPTRALVVGAAVAVAAMVRGEALVMAPILVAPMLLAPILSARRRAERTGPVFRAAIAHGGLMVVAAVAVLSPWLVRNARDFSQPVTLSTNSDEVLFYANCPDTYYGDLIGSWSYPCQERDRAANPGAEPQGDESIRVKYWRAKGVQYVRDNLDRVPVVMAARVARNWDLWRSGQNLQLMALESRPIAWSRVGQWLYWLSLPAALLGWRVARRRGVSTWPLMAQLVSTTVTAALVYGSVRFRATADAVLLILAAAAFAPVVARVEWRRHLAALGERARRTAARPGARAFMIVGAVVALPLPGLWRYQGPPMEEGFMLAFPERILNGELPHRDFLHLYGPGSLWVLAGLYRLFGVLIEVQRAVGLIQNLAIAFGLYWIVRRRSHAAAVVAAVVSLVIVLPPIGLTALAWNGALGAALCGLAAALNAREAADGDDHRRAARWWTLAGVLAGVAVLYRPDVVLAVGAAGLTLVWGRRRAEILRCVGAAAAVSSLYLVLLVTSGPGNVVRGLFLEPVFRLRAGRTLPAPPSPDEFDGFLQRAGGLRVAAWPLPQPHPPLQVFLWFFLVPVSAVFVLAVAVWAVRTRRDLASRALLAGAVFGVGILPQAFQRPDTAHFAWVSCVTFALVPMAIMTLGVRRVWVAGLPVAVVLLAAIPFYPVRTYADLAGQTFGRNVFSYPIRNGDRVFYYGSAEAAAAAQRVVDRLAAEAAPEERLFVGPVDLRFTPYSDAFIYYLLPTLQPATPYIEMDPGLANAPDSGLAEQVASADWLVQSDVWTAWDEPNASRDPGPDTPNTVVAERFCMVEDAGLFRLLRRCR